MTFQSIRPHVNGVALVTDTEQIETEELRQRACTELLRQAAMDADLLNASDPGPVAGAISPQAGAAIEALLERELKTPEPDEMACRRYYDAHRARYAVGERVRVRHVLFAVTPGVNVAALRQRAENCLLDLRCPAEGEENRFAQIAGELSNCPSGVHGGDLDWLTKDDCAPEFARAIFGQSDVGVLPGLVHSRFGLHVVEVLERDTGSVQPFESVRHAVSQSLQRQRFATLLRQYLQVLAGQATLVGVDMDAAATPLVQ